MRLSVLVTVGLLSATAVGCGGSDIDPNDPSQMQGQYGAQGQYGYGQQQGQYGSYPNYQQPAPAQPAPAQPAPAQPAPAQPASNGTGQATPIAPAMAAAATPIMQGMAAQEVPGMQPDGGAFAGQFSQGQVLEQAFN